MMTRKFALLLAGSTLGLLLASPTPARACPCLGFVDTDASEVGQSAMVIVEDDALHYILQLEVEGNSKEIGWLIPTPAVPDAPELTESTFFTAFNSRTEPHLIACSGGGGCGSDELTNLRQGAGVVIDEGRIGALEYAVLSGDGTDLGTWLTERNYPVGTEVQATIDRYVADGWSFVAMRIADDTMGSERTAIGPVHVRIPYTGEPVFPTGMTALSTGSSVDMLLYIVADGRMAPSNYVVLDRLDETALVAHEDYSSNYNEQVRAQIAEQEGGKGFVLEHADPVSVETDQDGLWDLVRDKMVVRLHTDMAPDKFDEDIRFELANDLANPNYQCVASEDEQSGLLGCTSARPAMNLLPFGLALVGLRLVRRRKRG